MSWWRYNPDVRLRQLGRGGSPEDEVRYLIERVRAGQLHPWNLRLAEAFGHQPSGAARERLGLPLAFVDLASLEAELGPVAVHEGWFVFDVPGGPRVEEIGQAFSWLAHEGVVAGLTDEQFERYVDRVTLNWVDDGMDAMQHVLRRAVKDLSLPHLLALAVLRDLNWVEYADMAHLLFRGQYLDEGGRQQPGAHEHLADAAHGLDHVLLYGRYPPEERGPLIPVPGGLLEGPPVKPGPSGPPESNPPRRRRRRTRP